MKGSDGIPVRVRFTKLGKVRFVSHRDVARAFERAFRIEQLPLSFTLGFSPRPKVSFGLALGVAQESVAEYLDLELAEAVEVDQLPERLSAALPDGIDVTGTCQLEDRAWGSRLPAAGGRAATNRSRSTRRPPSFAALYTGHRVSRRPIDEQRVVDQICHRGNRL